MTKVNANFVSEAKTIFKELVEHPRISSAWLVKSKNRYINVESVWTQKCLERSDSHKFRRGYVINADTSDVITRSNPQLHLDCDWHVISPSGQKSVVIRKHIPDKTKPAEEKWYFEVWASSGFCEKVINVSATEKHGAVYDDDGAFGSVAWNTTEDKIVYVAEKKKVESGSYFAKPSKCQDNPPEPGMKFVSTEDWGEIGGQGCGTGTREYVMWSGNH
ncbi:APEH [Bugula neritina]|uniref:APEH n=1 Tax=Bugula neritina TaxID=10212 RepID=A0A7J7JZJ5_BUGNE|nr:APEH [Bugula neritina]